MGSRYFLRSARGAEIDGDATNAPNVRTSSSLTDAYHSSAPTSVQQESEDDDTNSLIGEEVYFDLPNFSLAHQGRSSSSIVQETAEYTHYARLTAIERMRNDVFTCLINVDIEGITESCKAYCEIPASDMSLDVARAYRSRIMKFENFSLEYVSKGTTFENLSGMARLGSVQAEDYLRGTYTCKMEFCKIGAVNPWAGEVYVPKKHVPEYKLVDYKGERDHIASIQTSSEEQTAHEEEIRARCTVEFSRKVRKHREQMSADFWTSDGKNCFEEQTTQILAYEVNDKFIDLQFRARKDESSWWHFHGRMHRGLTHGRFHSEPEPVPNMESDAVFGIHWSDRREDAKTQRRLQKLRVRNRRQLGARL